ncbi:GFA family protein [Erythrobacter sp. HKB08]|uniref:GFA family protein n=1 Tax=Erythrobacter sp. HKB08 TaxID=2502843 RepID=UPI001008CB93|nr:GFA family protein [Erythrobacter sp. HKB08]
MAREGGCLCGAVRYTLASEPAMSMACHCTHCQKQSGTSFSLIVAVPESDIEITGEVQTYEDQGESGNTLQRQFCGKCGSPLFTLVPSAPNMVFIKAGTLDDTSGIAPAVHIWTKSKQEWLDLGDAPQVERNPG